MAAAGGIALVVRWYLKGGGVSGYRGEDAHRIELVRVQAVGGDYSH